MTVVVVGGGDRARPGAGRRRWSGMVFTETGLPTARAKWAACAAGARGRGCETSSVYCPAMGSCSSRAREIARVVAAMASMSSATGLVDGDPQHADRPARGRRGRVAGRRRGARRRRRTRSGTLMAGPPLRVVGYGVCGRPVVGAGGGGGPRVEDGRRRQGPVQTHALETKGVGRSPRLRTNCERLRTADEYSPPAGGPTGGVHLDADSPSTTATVGAGISRRGRRWRRAPSARRRWRAASRRASPGSAP